MRLETQLIHAGYAPDPTTKAVAVPIYQTTSYAFDNTQHGADLFDLKVEGNIYTRIMNPTQAVLEARVAALEGGVGALALASGMAAITYAILTIAENGDNIVTSSTLYGGTYNLFAHTLPQFGIEVRFADYRDPASFERLIDAKTKALFCESVGNPLGNVTDFEALAEIAHRHGIPLIVDNTVPTPYLCRPFEYGADIVVHALTKYLGGHGTTLGGIIVDSGKFPWADYPEKFRRLNEPDVSYHGVVYTEALGPAAYIGRARGAATQHGCSDQPVQRVPHSARHRNARRADGPHLRKRRSDCRIPEKPPESGVGQLRWASRPPQLSARAEIHERARFGHPQFRRQRGTRSGRPLSRRAQTLHAAGQYRRLQVARVPPGIDHPPSAGTGRA